MLWQTKEGGTTDTKDKHRHARINRAAFGNESSPGLLIKQGEKYEEKR